MRKDPLFRHALRSAFCLLASLAVLSGSAGAAFADAGDASDPNDIEGPVDLAKVSHTDDDEYVTYRMETHNRVGIVQEFFKVTWDFDLDGDGVPQESCIILTQDGEGEGGLQANLYPGCGPETYATTNVKPDGNAVEFKFLLRDVVYGASLPADKKFGYRVTAWNRGGSKDFVPDEGLVEQGGLPTPPKPEAPPPTAEASSMQLAGQHNGVPPGEGPGGAPGQDPSAMTNAESGGSAPAGSEGISGRTWLLAVGLPALVLVGVLLLTRRRREEELTTAMLEAEEPLVPTLVPATDDATSVSEAPTISNAPPNASRKHAVTSAPAPADPWYLPNAPPRTDHDATTPPDSPDPDRTDQAKPWTPWMGATERGPKDDS